MDLQEMRAVIDGLNKDFTYVSDKKKYGFNDVWRRLGSDGEGDCEDYSLELLSRLAGGSELKMAIWVLTGKAKILHLKHRTRGTGHVALQFDGLYADNITAKWSTTLIPLEDRGYKHVFTWYAPFLLAKIIVSNVLAIPFRLFK